MHHLLAQTLGNETSLAAVQTQLLKLLAHLRHEDGGRIAFVSGAVFSDGLEHFERNIGIINHHTDLVRATFDGSVFSCADAFYNLGLQSQLDVYDLPYEERRQRFLAFWRTILAGGVTDIFMIPGWERSEGAQDEHQTAAHLKLRIHYL
jgi:hypothetical protein